MTRWLIKNLVIAPVILFCVLAACTEANNAMDAFNKLQKQVAVNYACNVQYAALMPKGAR